MRGLQVQLDTAWQRRPTPAPTARNHHWCSHLLSAVEALWLLPAAQPDSQRCAMRLHWLRTAQKGSEA